MSAASPPKRDWPLIGLVLLVFLFLLGTRSLNEPDEGRYGEIAREMVETGNWLAPHIWFVPHLDKPPMTYWLVASSLSVFGFNEWAVRLPLALAGLSGVWATFLLAHAMAGAQAARWSALILSTSVLYFAMARMLTTDIFLTQFIAWALYFLWRSWQCLDDLSSPDEDVRGAAGKKSVGWQLAAWVAMAGGFVTKGPLALLIPLPPLVALLIYRRRDAIRLNVLLFGALGGVTAFCALALPWYLMVFDQLPGSYEFMVKGQVMAHAAGAEAKGRAAPPYYFFGILAVGFLPWTLLLGWLWRRGHWRALDDARKNAWLFLSVWAVFTFTVFSINSSKLPAYILPMFPALAVMVAWRWFAGEQAEGQGTLPLWTWRAVMVSPFLAMLAFPLVCYFEFKARDAWWIWPQVGLACAAGVVLWLASRRWLASRCANWAVGTALVQLFLLVAVTPTVETHLKSNQTLKPLAEALKREYRPGDAIVAWGRLPQGLPFYAYPVINATNRPYMGGMPKYRLPFEFPGNEERLGQLVLPDEKAFAQMLSSERRVLAVGFRGTYNQARQWAPAQPLHLITEVGQWELFTNRQ
ncbi:MAG: glycosyltransferase family 39 protein [Verrucomicrobiota bacterium]